MTQTAAAADSTKPHGPQAQRRSRWRRRLLWTVGVLLVALILIGVFLPTIASTGAGKSLVLGIVNRFFAGTVDVEQLSLGWSAGQRITGLTVNDSAGQPFISAQAIEAPGMSLWSALRGDTTIGHLRVVGGIVKVDQLQKELGQATAEPRPVPRAKPRDTPRADGTTPRVPRPRRRIFPDVSVKIELIDAKLHYASTVEEESIELSLRSALLDFSDPTRIHTAFEADVRQGAHHGRFDGDVTLTDLFDSDGMIRSQGFKIDGEVNASAVPVAFLDRTLKLDGTLVAVVGPMVEAALHASGDGAQFDSSVTVKSERFSMKGQFVRDNGEITVKEPGAMAQLQLSREAWKALEARFPALRGTTLLEPFAIRAVWTDLALPSENRTISWPRSRASAQITVDDVLLEAPAAGRILVTGTKMRLTSESIGRHVDASLSAMVEHEGRRGNLDVSASIRNLVLEATPDVAKRDDANVQGINARVNCKLTDLPVVLLDRFVPKLKRAVSEAIGPLVNLEVDAHLSRPDGATQDALAAPYTLNLASQRLNAELAGTLDLTDLKVTSSGSCNVTVKPDLLRRVSEYYVDRHRDQLPQSLWQLAMMRDATATVTLENLVVPLRSFDPAGIGGSVTLAVRDLALTGAAGLDPVSLGRAVVRLDRPAGGGDASFQAEAQVTHGQDKGLLQAEGHVRALDGPAPVLEATCQTDLVLTPRLVALLKEANILALPETYSALTLSDTARLHGGLTDVRVPFTTPFDPAAITGSLSVGVDKLSAVGVDSLQRVTLREVRLEIADAALNKPLSFKAGAQIESNGEPGRIDAEGTISDLTKPERIISARVRATSVSLPLRLLREGSGDAVVTVNADIAGRMHTNNHIAVTRPSFLEFDVTPKIYGAIVGGPSEPGREGAATQRTSQRLTLAAPARLRLDLRKAQIGLTQSTDGSGEPVSRPDPSKCQIDVAASIPVVSFRAVESGRQITLRNVKAFMNSTDLSGTNSLEVRGTVETKVDADGDAHTTPLSSLTKISNLIGSDGRINLEQVRVQTKTNLPDLPVAVIDAVAQLEGKLIDGLGPVASIQLNGNVPGPISLRFASQTVDLPVDLQVQRSDGRVLITLPQDIKAKFKLTERSAKALFGHVHPVFADAVASEDWIRLLIRRKPFYVPLANFEENLSKLAIDATLEFGTLRMRRKGWLTQGLNDLTSTAAKWLRIARGRGGRSAQTQTYLARFTPIDVTVRNGMLTSSEFWVTSEDLAIGFQSPKQGTKYEQGGSNLVTGKYRFAMGLLGASLIADEPFLIQVVDPKTIYNIPISGSVEGDPNISKDDLKLGLAGSLAKQQQHRFGSDVQPWIDLIRKKVDQKRKKAREELGLSWNLPPEAEAFLQGIIEKHSDKKEPDEQTQEPGQDEEPKPQEPQKKKRRKKLEDELIDQLPGLLDEFLK